MHRLPEKIATLIDASLDRVESQLVEIQRQQTEIKGEVRSSRQRILLLVACVGIGVWLVKRDTGKSNQQDRQIIDGQQDSARRDIDGQQDSARRDADLAAQLSQVQQTLSDIQQNTDPKTDPLSKWPQERLETELARRTDRTVEDLRALLAAGRTSLDALVAGQALLASGKSEAADKKFDLVLHQEQFAADRMRQAWEGKAQIAFDAVHYEQALEYLQKAAALVDKTAGPLAWADAHASVEFVLDKLALYKEAEPLDREIVRIREEKLGPNDPKLATALNNLALLLQATNRLTEAEPLMRRARKIDEDTFGSDHPNVARDLNNLAQLLDATNRRTEAEPMMRRALKIDEDTFGPDHPNVAIRLNNLALLLDATNRLTKAEPLFRRAVHICIAFRNSTGHEHPNFKAIADNYLGILFTLGMSEPERRAELESLAGELGMEKADVMAQFASVLGPADVTVKVVLPEGQRPALGIRAGDIVRRYNGEAITKKAQIVKLTGESKGEAIPLEIQRGTETLKLTAKPGRLGLVVENKPQK